MWLCSDIPDIRRGREVLWIRKGQSLPQSWGLKCYRYYVTEIVWIFLRVEVKPDLLRKANCHCLTSRLFSVYSTILIFVSTNILLSLSCQAFGMFRKFLACIHCEVDSYVWYSQLAPLVKGGTEPTSLLVLAIWKGVVPSVWRRGGRLALILWRWEVIWPTIHQSKMYSILDRSEALFYSGLSLVGGENDMCLWWSVVACGGLWWPSWWADVLALSSRRVLPWLAGAPAGPYRGGAHCGGQPRDSHYWPQQFSVPQACDHSPCIQPWQLWLESDIRLGGHPRLWKAETQRRNLPSEVSVLWLCNYCIMLMTLKHFYIYSDTSYV